MPRAKRGGRRRPEPIDADEEGVPSEATISSSDDESESPPKRTRRHWCVKKRCRARCYEGVRDLSIAALLLGAALYLCAQKREWPFDNEQN